MNTCYCDESGTGDQPIVTMVGILVDSGRMHLTKTDWRALLAHLSEVRGRPIQELHAADFYHGNGVWRGMEALERIETIDDVLKWLADRKHRVIYTSAVKSAYEAAREDGRLPPELRSIWQLVAFHLALAIQRHSQKEGRNKGHTVLQIDDNSVEKGHFIDLISSPPTWSDDYYERAKNREQLDQIVDMPNFSDSRKLPLIQLADFLAFFLRRYAELSAGLSEEQYAGERDRLTQWTGRIAERSIPLAHVYPKQRKTESQSLFYDLAPPSIRDLRPARP